MIDNFMLKTLNEELDYQIFVANRLYEQTKHESFKKRAEELEKIKIKFNDNRK